MSPKKLKALSVRNPYAGMMFADWPHRKFVENRSWKSDGIIGQRIAIHVSVTPDYYDQFSLQHMPPKAKLSLGMVIGTAKVVDIFNVRQYMDDMSLEDALVTEKIYGYFYDMVPRVGGPQSRRVIKQLVERWLDFDAGFAWILSEPELLDVPVKGAGRLGLWDVTL